MTTDDVGLEAYGDAPLDPIVSQTGFAILCLGLVRDMEECDAVSSFRLNHTGGVTGGIGNADD